MSPQLLARLSEFRRSMAVCGTTSDGHLSSTTIYGSWQPRGGWLALFVACEAIERLEEEDDDEFERRPYTSWRTDGLTGSSSSSSRRPEACRASGS